MLGKSFQEPFDVVDHARLIVTPNQHIIDDVDGRKLCQVCGDLLPDLWMLIIL